jgi:hypothetical protein
MSMLWWGSVVALVEFSMERDGGTKMGGPCTQDPEHFPEGKASMPEREGSDFDVTTMVTLSWHVTGKNHRVESKLGCFSIDQNHCS